MGENETVECVRCGAEITKEEASALTDGDAMWKILCSECLRAVGVPKTYELVRDITGTDR